MNVLVTGSAGRVGGAICRQLRPRHRVVGLDRRPGTDTTVAGDLRDPGLVRRLLKGMDAVVHVAALHAPQVGVVDDAEFASVNVQGTRTLAELAAAAGVRRFVFTSTTALYGRASTPPDAARWVDEGTVPQPRTVYHRSKLAAEALLRELAQRGALAVTVLRMARCFPEPAPRMAAYRLHRGVDARDVAQAHALALHDAAPGYRCFVISGPTPFTAQDCGDLLHDAPKVIARRAPALAAAYAQRGWPLPPSIDRVYDATRALEQLGWQPRFGFDEVLRQLDAASPEVLPAAQTAW